MSVSRLRIPRDPFRRRIWAAAALAAAILALAPAGLAEKPAVWAIINARIVPVSSPVIEKGSIVIRNGIIEAVGTSVSVPADARTIDAAGLTVYPGLIDALSDIGIEEARPQAQAQQRPGAAPAMPPQAQQPEAPPSEETQGLTPYRQAAEILNAGHRKVESARNAGVTTTLVAPRGGFFPGQSTLINLSGSGAGRMVVKTPVAYHIQLGAARGFGRGYPGSLMGIIAFVKQTLMDAQRYDVAWNAYRTAPGVARPEYSRALEALQPVVKERIPVVLSGNSPTEIERAIYISEMFNLNLILSGCMEAGPVASLLKQKDIPVLIGVKYPEKERDADPEAREELNAMRRRLDAPGNAAALAGAGVRFAFMSDDMANPRDFVRNVGKAVEAGLSRDAALRALTLSAAEILGVADRFGSIEKNKTANLVLATGDIFATSTRVKYAFVDGIRFEIPEAETPAERPAEGAPRITDVSGTWNIVINSPQGPMDVTLALAQKGTAITGTVSSPLGVTEIYDGSVTGNRVSFKISLSGTGMGDMEVLFSGSIQDTQIAGTASVGDMGSFDFTGSKRPGELAAAGGRP